MAEARDRAAWNRSLALLAALFNVHRDPARTKPIDPMQFFPWDRPPLEQAPPPTLADLKMLRRVFPGTKRGDA